MKKVFITAIAMWGLTVANSANACTYKIDEAVKSAELQKVALSSLGNITVLSSSVSNFSFFESKPTPMCPEELTYNGVVTASIKYLQSTCIVKLDVKKVESWSESDLDTYTVTGRKNINCSK